MRFASLKSVGCFRAPPRFPCQSRSQISRLSQVYTQCPQVPCTAGLVKSTIAHTAHGAGSLRLVPYRCLQNAGKYRNRRSQRAQAAMFSSIGTAFHMAEVVFERVLQTVGVLAVLGALVYAAVLWVRRQALQSADLNVPEYSLEGKELPAKVVKVYDGDTVHVVIHMQDAGPLPPLVRYKVRLDGVDTPEMRTKNPKEKLAAVAARDRLLQLVAGDAQIVRFKCGKFDKYGRLLGEIFVDPFMGKAEKSVNQVLIDEGYAYAYDGGTKTEFRQ